MSILIILIVFSLSIALLFLSLFSWAVRDGQYQDTDSPAIRLLYEDKPAKEKAVSQDS